MPDTDLFKLGFSQERLNGLVKIGDLYCPKKRLYQLIEN